MFQGRMNELLTVEKKRQILDKVGSLVLRKAVRLCPIDLGQLRASLKYEVDPKGNSVTIYSELDYAKDMEYGKPPSILSETEKGLLAEWAKRHDLPAYPVIRKIQKEGIKAGTVEDPLKTMNGTFRPFLRPALYQTTPEIIKLIKGAM